MIPQRPPHPQPSREVYYFLGVRPVGERMDRIPITEDAARILSQKGCPALPCVAQARYCRTVGQANRQEMDRFYAACKDLLAILLPGCWHLAKWCLYHGSRLLWKTLTWLCQIVTSLLKSRFIPEDRNFWPRGYTTVERIAHRQCRQCREKHRSSTARRCQHR